MKKYFLSFIAICILFILASGVKAHTTFADVPGATFTWTGNIGLINVSGGDLQTSPTQLANTGGDLNIKDPTAKGGFCTLDLTISPASDNKSAKITASNLFLPSGAIKCPANIMKEWTTTVPLKGTPPNNSAALKLVTIIVNDPNGSSAPGSVTFTIGKQTQTAKKENVPNTQGGASYEVDFNLDPGNYKVCAKPVLPALSCSSFTKKTGVVLHLTFGTLKSNLPVLSGVPLLGTLHKDSIYVGVLLDLSCDTNAFKATLEKDGKVIQTITLSLAPTISGDPVIDKNISGEFTKVAPGDYTVCINTGTSNDCSQGQDITKVAGTPGTIAFNDAASAGVGVAAGGPSICQVGINNLPTPPLPPCVSWSNGAQGGICKSFLSAFGDFPTDPEGFIQKIFAVLLSVSGGIALLLIIRAGYQLMVSQGKPEQIQQARDQLIAAIVGLVFLIFSFVFLQLIGFDILHIPGFGDGSGPSAKTCNGAGLQYCTKTNQCLPASSTCP